MTVRLRPEIERLIQADIQRGPYQSIHEFVEHAVVLLHEEEQWLSSNKEEIAAMIEVGFAQAERGELIEPEAATRLLRERHAARSAKR